MKHTLEVFFEDPSRMARTTFRGIRRWSLDNGMLRIYNIPRPIVSRENDANITIGGVSRVISQPEYDR